LYKNEPIQSCSDKPARASHSRAFKARAISRKKYRLPAGPEKRGVQAGKLELASQFNIQARAFAVVSRPDILEGEDLN